MTSTEITYAELAKRLDNIFLFNKVPELDVDIFTGLENGEYWQDDGEYNKEVYQWYLITPSDAEYLKEHTDELIFYSDVLDEYVWGVTHWGTSWDGVTLELKEQ